MARGGPRPGSGRPPGAANAKTREIADRVMAEGITPLEVMLQTMRERWEAGDKDGAVAVAKDAAPYVHPKLANVDAKHSGPDGGAINFTWLPPQ